MLDKVNGLPDGVVGLRANGVVIAQDISQALALMPTGPDGSLSLIVYIDPDLDGYLAEIVSALDKAAGSERPGLFQRWALVAPDGVVSEAEGYREAGKLRIFPQSRSAEALGWAATGK